MAEPPSVISPADDTADSRITVMLVDDSAVIRGILRQMLSRNEAISVIASVGTGKAAVDALDSHDPDVILLDIEMPVMDGMTALPLILKKRHRSKIIVMSTLTRRNAKLGLAAIEAGASDYLPKPGAARDMTTDPAFAETLIQKTLGLGEAARRHRAERTRHLSPDSAKSTPPSRPRPISNDDVAGRTPMRRTRGAKSITLRPASRHRPQVVAIGSSTGGPQALFRVFSQIRDHGGLDLPVVITQHMPPMFTALLAEQIQRVVQTPVKEAVEGEPLRRGEIYIAPGGHHLEVICRDGVPVTHISDAAAENFCRPSVDPMFRSVARVFQSRSLAVVLTGMGSDGARGALAVADAGGTVIAQDEETSVVWGMPGATARTGACAAILPLEKIAAYILRTVSER